jgi:hypothetical protein
MTGPVSQADLTTGDLPQDAVGLEQVNYLWFTHNRSPDLRHDLEWDCPNIDLSEALRHEFARSIAIVSPGGIDEFLKAEWAKLFL